MDALTIITGIFAISFLLFYLSSLLQRGEHDIAKLILVVAGLMFMLFIPSQLEELDKTCAITFNGTYYCYDSNGTQITDFGEGNTVGQDTFMAFITLLNIIFVYVLAYVGFKLFKKIGLVDRWTKRLRQKLSGVRK